jgi:outer membrane protein assembly factor BamB
MNKQINRWTNIAKDNTYSGHADFRGSMSGEPDIVFTEDVSNKTIYLSVGLGSDSTMYAEADGAISSASDMQLYQKWQAGTPDMDLPGFKLPELAYIKYGHFIPGMPELQLIECDSCFDCPYGSRMRIAKDDSEYLFTRLKILKDGHWRQVWETDNINYLACGQPVIGDFDGDGQLELCVTPWYNCYFYDLRTGKEKYFCPNTPDGMESGRAYGLTMAVDIDGDGFDEALTMSDMENHVTMMKFSDGKMRRHWAVMFERGTMQKKSVHRFILDPAADLDQDGVKEIGIVLYNQTGDQLWHFLALNGLTGEVKYDLPGFCAREIKKIGGKHYIFGYRTSSFEQGNRMQVIIPERGSFRTVFDKKGSFLETPILRTAPYLSHIRTAKVADLEDNQGLLFFSREADAVNLYRLSPDKPQLAGSIYGAGSVEAASVCSYKGTALLQLALPVHGQAILEGRGIELQYVGRAASDFQTAQPVIADYPDGVTRLFIQSSQDKIDQFSVAEGTVRKDFSINGTGTRQHFTKGPVLADIHGNGDFALVAFTSDKSGQGSVTAFDKNGQVIWSHVVEGVPYGSLNALCKGHLRGDAGDDVIVFFSKAYGTGSGLALDGRTGAALWQRDEGVPAFNGSSSLPFGGQASSIVDVDGDGDSEIAIVFPYHFALVSGQTGLIKKYINTMNWSDHELFKFKEDCSAGWAMTAVYDFLGNGREQYLYTGTSNVISVVDVPGDQFIQMWDDLHPMWAPSTMPGIGDIDGDGQVEVFCPGWRTKVKGHEGDFRCLDARTGREKWRLPTEGDCFTYAGAPYRNAPTMAVSADLNGDGKDECLFGIGNKLFCVGVPESDHKGRYLWAKEFPGKISHPTPALLGNQAAVILTCADGKLYIISCA